MVAGSVGAVGSRRFHRSLVLSALALEVVGSFARLIRECFVVIRVVDPKWLIGLINLFGSIEIIEFDFF